ncbi:MAG: hypothetical protein ACU0DW_05810 [Shimia sp.]
MGKLMKEFLLWPLEVIGTPTTRVPKRLFTRAPFDADGALDSLTALLLPGDDIPSPVGDWSLPLLGDDCLGLWMGTSFPFPSLRASKNTSSFWICNFPATGLYDHTFTQSLSEVGLGPEQEGRNLSTFKTARHSILLTITPEQTLADLATVSPDAVLIVLSSSTDIERIRAGFLDEVRKAFGSETPLVLHGGPENHLPRSPSGLGIDALLHTPVSA